MNEQVDCSNKIRREKLLIEAWKNQISAHDLLII